MIRLLKPGDMRPFVCLSAACRSIIPAEAAFAGAAGPHARGNPVAWLDYARSFRPTFRQALGGPTTAG